MISDCNYFCMGLNWWSIYHIWFGGQFTISGLVVYFPYLDWWSIYHMWTGGLSTISWLVVYLSYLDWWSIYHTLSSGHFTTSRVSVFLAHKCVGLFITYWWSFYNRGEKSVGLFLTYEIRSFYHIQSGGQFRLSCHCIKKCTLILI